MSEAHRPLTVHEATRWAHQARGILPAGVAFSADFNARRLLDCASVGHWMLNGNVLRWEFRDGSVIESNGKWDEILPGGGAW